MPAVAIFRTHLVAGLLAWALYAAIYWYPKLKAVSRRDALRQIAMLHAFRFEGLLFLMPAFVGNGLPAAFAIPAAYGDLTTSMLAIVSIVTYRWERVSMVFTVLYTVIGTADLINNVYRVIALGIDKNSDLLGVAYLIPILYVPILFITHGIAAWLLFKPAERVVNSESYAARKSQPAL